MYFYTEEQKSWIIENSLSYNNSFDLCLAFNSRFSCNKNPQALKAIRKRLMPKTSFKHSGGCKKGSGSSVTASPLGSERFTGGYWYIKIDKKPLSKNYTQQELRENWVQKHRYLWEKEHGKIPKGGIIVFLDSNRNNFNLENLYCTTRKISVYMMRHNLYSEDPNITLTSIKWCELKYAIKLVL